MENAILRIYNNYAVLASSSRTECIEKILLSFIIYRERKKKIKLFANARVQYGNPHCGVVVNTADGKTAR